MNLRVICRTCLLDVKKEPVGLTEQLFNFLENIGLREVPRSHSQVDLPANICLNCYRTLVNFQRFYAQCQKAQEFLKSKLKTDNMQYDDDDLDAFDNENSCNNYNSHNADVDKEDEENYIETIETIEIDDLVESDDNEEPPEKKKTISVLYVCKVCAMEFNGKGDLRKHEMTHPGLRPFVCNVCGAGFKDRTAINYHLTIHYGKTFPCTQCDQKCATRSMLRSHVRFAHGNQSFQCDQCGQIFKTGHLLSCHKTKHNGTQEYLCRFCSKAYYNRHDLLNHIKLMHIYYNCNFCNSAYKKLIRIRDHLKNNHDVTGNTDEHFTKNYGSQAVKNAERCIKTKHFP